VGAAKKKKKKEERIKRREVTWVKNVSRRGLIISERAVSRGEG
jgi:hypothetical protein